MTAAEVWSPRHTQRLVAASLIQAPQTETQRDPTGATTREVKWTDRSQERLRRTAQAAWTAGPQVLYATSGETGSGPHASPVRLMRGRLHLLLLAILVPSASAEEQRGAAGACATGSLQGPSGADAVTSINSPGGTPPHP